MKLKDYLKEHFQDIKGMYTYGDGGTVSIKGSTVRVPPAITQKMGLSNLRVGMDQLNAWHNEEAIKMVLHIMKWWGTPNVLTHNKAKWFKVAGWDRLCVKDESVPHTGLVEFHVDSLYCTKNSPVPPAFQSPLAEILPNVMYDGLKRSTTIRCNDIIMNAVVMGFIEDVVKGETEPTMEALEERLDSGDMPRWFELPNQAYLYREEIKQQDTKWKDEMTKSGGKYGRGYHWRIGKFPGDMEQDLNIKEAVEEVPKGEQPDIDWKKLEDPREAEYLNKVLKGALKTKNKKVLVKLKDMSKSGKVKIDWKKLEDPREKAYLDKITEAKKPTFRNVKDAQKFYEEAYPEFTPESIEKGLKAAFKKHKALDPVTVNYFLSNKRFGGLGFGEEK